MPRLAPNPPAHVRRRVLRAHFNAFVTRTARAHAHGAGAALLVIIACSQVPTNVIRPPAPPTLPANSSNADAVNYQQALHVNPNSSPAASVSTNAPVQHKPDVNPEAFTAPASAAPLPNVAFNEQGTFTELSLQASGFPAIAKNGQVVAVAFHELNTSGPAALELCVQLYSVASGKITQTLKFREAYSGEREASALKKVKARVREWVTGVNQRLLRADLVTMAHIASDSTAVCNDDAPALHLQKPPLEARLTKGHLVVRNEAHLVFERAYPEWVRANGDSRNRCEYQPYLTEVAYDAEHEVLVVKADHCSPSDLCPEGISPEFAVVLLPTTAPRGLR